MPFAENYIIITDKIQHMTEHWNHEITSNTTSDIYGRWIVTLG